MVENIGKSGVKMNEDVVDKWGRKSEWKFNEKNWYKLIEEIVGEKRSKFIMKSQVTNRLMIN